MSDLYLVLRHRLETVTEWVPLGSDVMRQARDRLGLSYESVARLVSVSSKTYERYEKRGAVPRPLVVKIAETLNLEIEQSAPVRVTVPASVPQDAALAEILDAIRSLDGEVRQLRAAVRQLEGHLPPSVDAPANATQA